ncbi:MAG TPA: PQQ-binding-like beta-propeller repeat protein [bacterium]|nr:PQQ-binding-like beta-propeller repeat protein [bacterium]HQL63292.1 PQQ-binding-like beta-propeller repeat protein [bacterium]
MSVLRSTSGRSVTFLLMFLILPYSAFSAQAQLKSLWKLTADEGYSAPNLVCDTATGKVIGIAVARTNIGLVFINPDGTTAWELPLQPPVTAGPAVCDLDSDGSHQEIIAVDCVGNLVCASPKGEILWKVKLPTGITGWGNPAAADLDGDGKSEVVVADRAGNVSCLAYDGKLLWRFQGEVGELGTPLIADLYENPGLEIVITSHERDIYALDSKGNWLWDIHVPQDLFPNSTPVLADLFGKGKADLFVGGGLNHLIRIDLETAKILDMFQTYQHINDAIAVGDLDGDGREIVLAANKSGNLFAYGATGDSGESGLLWQFDMLSSGPFLAAPILANLDDDPGTEILLFTAGQDTLTALNPDGSVLWQQDFPGTKASITPCAGDIDGDGTSDLVISQRPSTGGPGELCCISLGVPYRPNEILWDSVAANPANTCRGKHQVAYRPLPPWNMFGPVNRGMKTSSLEGSYDLFTGPNTWRRKISVESQGRHALFTWISAPNGFLFISVKHTERGSDSLRMDFDIHDKGTYQIQDALLDCSKSVPGKEYAIRACYIQEVEFTPIETDVRYISQVLEETGAIISNWKDVNPTVQSACQKQLHRLQFDLTSASQFSGKDEEKITLLTETRLAAERFRQIVQVSNADGAKCTFIAWTASPWAYFHQSKSIPAPGTLVEKIEWTVCKNEYEPAIVNLTNVSGRTLEVRVVPKDWTSAEKDVISGRKFLEFHRAVTGPTYRREEIADALPMLDQGRLLTIAPWESAQLWINLLPTDAKAGIYQGTLRLMTLEPDSSEMEIPVSVEVVDLSLPRPRPLRFCTWSYITHHFTGMEEAVRKDLLAHANTVFLAPCPGATFDADGNLMGEIDYSQHDEFVCAYRAESPGSFFLFSSAQNAVRGPEFLSAGWERGYETYLKQWVKHLKELGVRYDQFALYPYDEPNLQGSNVVDQLITVAKATRKADPNILIYTDPTTGSTVDLIENLAPYIDIWCPSAELIERSGEDLIPLFKKYGKEVWFYDAAGYSRTLSTLGIYRWRPWESWSRGFTGCGHWVYSSHPHDLWLGPNPSANYYPTVYDGEGVVTSKRWEACREGAEDYEYLYLLREMILSAKEKGVAKEKIDKAQAVLERADTITKILCDVGRRVSTDTDGVPLYNEATDTLNRYRKEVLNACLPLR